MLASRLTTVPLSAFVTSFGKSSVRSIKPVLQFQNVSRIQQNSTRSSRVMTPGAFTIGKGILAVVSTGGLGALCYYGLELSNESGTPEHAELWPDYIKKRVRDTYMYFSAHFGVTAATAVAVSRNVRLMNLMAQPSFIFLGLIGTGILCFSLPYEKGFGAKQMAWLLFTGVSGAAVASIMMLGFPKLVPIIVRPAWYAAGVVGGLSAVAMCAPSKEFLNIGAPLAIGLGVVLASSIGSLFLPDTKFRPMKVYVYAVIVLFSLFLLYDTNKIMKKAETHPPYAAKPFDPINVSLGSIIIYFRIASMLEGSGGRMSEEKEKK